MLTSSAIKTYMDCPRKYEWAYVYNIRPIRQSDALRFGSLFHDVFELLDNGIAWKDICKRTLNRAATKVEAQQVLRLTAEHHWHHGDDGYTVEETEGVFRTTIGGYECGGKRDRIVRLPDGRRALQEYKTSSEDISPGSLYWRRLRMDIQVSIYFLSSGVETIIYDVTRKPTIRQWRKETVQEYGQRLTDDIRIRPEYYFRRQEVARSQADIDAAVEDVACVGRLIELEQFPRNTASCTRYGECPYFTACSVNARPADGVPVGFERLETAHPELADESTTATPAAT